MDFEEIIRRLRNNNVMDNCHDCGLGYVAFEAADAIEGLLKMNEIRETPQAVVQKDYHDGWYNRIFCPVCGKMQKNAKRNASMWYCERCGQALTGKGE